VAWCRKQAFHCKHKQGDKAQQNNKELSTYCMISQESKKYRRNARREHLKHARNGTMCFTARHSKERPAPAIGGAKEMGRNFRFGSGKRQAFVENIKRLNCLENLPH